MNSTCTSTLNFTPRSVNFFYIQLKMQWNNHYHKTGDKIKSNIDDICNIDTIQDEVAMQVLSLQQIL